MAGPSRDDHEDSRNLRRALMGYYSDVKAFSPSTTCNEVSITVGMVLGTHAAAPLSSSTVTPSLRASSGRTSGAGMRVPSR